MMDSSSSEISKNSNNVDENIQPTENSTQETIASKDSELVEVKENMCEELITEKTISELASAKQREAIEILNVELVACSRVDCNDADSSKNDIMENEIIVYDENIPVCDKETNSLGIDVDRVGGQSKTNNRPILPDNEIETVAETAQESNNNRIETLTSTLEPLEVTARSSLSLIAQYQSDDDSDSVIEVPTISTQDYRTHVVEIDSNSDSDDSSDSSGVEYISELRKTIQKRIEVADEGEEDADDNDDGAGNKRYQPKLRVKGELLLEDLPPIQELQITVPEDECIEFGKIHSIVDQLVLVSVLPNSILLNLETVIFLEKGQKVLGEVFDVLGQVADPLYCVRFNSNNQIKEKQINVGDVVYVAPKSQYTQYVILSNLMQLKGSDASWENDMEPPPRFLDYSDDEQEQLARRQLRNKDRPVENEDQSKKPRTVDDEDDDSVSVRSYNPNTRHKNLCNEQRNSRGGLTGHSNVQTRPRYNGPHRNPERTPNYHRNSWHSNYYPQPMPPHHTGSFGYGMHSNQLQSSQHLSAYGMPPVHNMPYQPTRYGPPPMFDHHARHLMPNAFSVRPPTIRGPPQDSHQHQYSCTPPPPPGSQ